VLPHAAVECGEVVEAGGIVGVVLPQHFLFDLFGLEVEWLGLGVLPHAAVECGEVVEAGGIVGVVLPKHFLADRQRFLKQR
jgi:hypothetical protein